MKFPDFIIAGFSKCGTTGLLATLGRHPQVAHHDEVHFFNNNERWRRGVDWYKSRFDGSCAGEKTPAYVYSSRGMQRMARTVPAVRLIFCVRNPVDRLYSWYQDKIVRERKVAPEELPFTAYRDFKPKVPGYDPLATGCYARLLRENVFTLFQRSRCLIVVQEQMKRNPQRELDRVLQFLELPPLELPVEQRKVSLYSEPMPAPTRAELIEYYRPHNAEFYELTGLSIPEWDR